MDPIAWGFAGAGSGWIVVGVMVRMLFRGTIIPGSTHKELVAAKDERIATQDELLRHLSEQNGVLLDAGIPALTEFMNGLRRAAGDQT